MNDELNALDEFREKNFPTLSLKKLIDIIRGDVVRKGNIEYDFSQLRDIFETWEHLTTNCIHYGRIWIAQDESRLACLEEENRLTSGGYDTCTNHKCKDYKPMIKGKSLDELVKDEKVEFT
jgi:UDP-N-acetylmuramate-alanine ligase